MRCRFLKDTELRNPIWSEADSRAAKEHGVEYEIPETIEVSAGFVIECPLAWIHCCPGVMNSKPIAEPGDDECRAKVREWMEEKRPAAIAGIKAQLDQIDSLKNPDDRKRLRELAKAYGLVGSAATDRSAATDGSAATDRSAATE